MAKLLFISFLLLTIFLSAASFDPKNSIPRRKAKPAAIIHYYAHAAVGGPSPNVYEVARASVTEGSPTQFGQVSVMDSKLTVGPDKDSPELGRVQGMLVWPDMQETALMSIVSVVFTAGLYNGSTLSAFGRNPVRITTGREVPIVGGSGFFQMAKGYVIENLYLFDPVENYFVMNNTAYVFF
ncbi:dirigent protein 21-like [Andrographis paniculata]|uniref:dirigent protein 21-like n=1 Tax=Andrographis paniculata TaxID=175694 RepID=UPI0021E81D18|nr:dirigent protein 21-like [Andrographis paniculata]